MITPEKNDVDISKLFNWGSKFAITNEAGDEIVEYYMKLPGDADINRARVYALRKSAELRRKLNDVESDERLAFVAESDLAGRVEIETFIVLTKGRDFWKRAGKEVNMPFPKEPADDASLEEYELYQAEIDSFPERLTEEITAKILAYNNVELDRLSRLTDEEVYKEYVKMSINEMCESEMTRRFRDMTIFFASFKDKDYEVPFFKVVEELGNLNAPILNQFHSNYESLEVGMDDLKK